ncbi:hypothetical protein JOM56_000485 [Amanita muscaria]
MSLSKCASAALSPVHPPLGTLIDGHSLELVEVLGVGGYGVVYRAVDTDPLSLTGHLKSYAVKCLISSPNASSRQRHVHIREIALHQLASVHPGVVTLHRVIEHQNATYIIMDYAPDHDLFTQILRNCRYLGNDDLIRHIFLQLLDAVEYCHLLGIYHRDLKPENVLCFDGGLRVAITDFGLATTEKMSDEFRTGSVYHMSPECQGGEFAPDGYYSPQANDVWSLGIVLLNLATGRNPWKSATVTDPTFQAYLHDPQSFLPSVLPISYSANELLLRMLDVNWRTRMTLPEVRRAIKMLDTFYCDGVIFEGSMARCPWEASMELDSEEEEIANDVDERVVNEWRKKAGVYSVDESSSSSSSSSSSEEDYGATEDSGAIAESLAGIPPQSTKSALAPAVTPTSDWSADSDTSQIIFANNSHTSSMGVPWTDFTSSKATWGCESSMSSICQQTAYGYSSDIEFPFDSVDPNNHRYPSVDISEDENFEYKISATEYRTDDTSVTKIKPGLKLNTHLDALRDDTSIGSVSSASSETMQTAHEYENYSSSSIYFLADSSVLPKSPVIPLSASISADSSTYEDPSSFLHTNEHISQLLTPLKDAIMASPSTDEDPWPSNPLARTSFSGISSPSRYSVASVLGPPLDTKWSDAEPQEEPTEIRLSPIPSRENSWNRNASVRTGGIRSPYYTFCRSNAPSPEESALRLAAQKSTELFEAPSGEAWALRASDESLLQNHRSNPVLLSRKNDSSPNGFLKPSWKIGNKMTMGGALRALNLDARWRFSTPCGSYQKPDRLRSNGRQLARIQATRLRQRRVLARHPPSKKPYRLLKSRLVPCRPLRLKQRLPLSGNTAQSDDGSQPRIVLLSEPGQFPPRNQEINLCPEFNIGEPPFTLDHFFVDQATRQNIRPSYFPRSQRLQELPHRQPLDRRSRLLKQQSPQRLHHQRLHRPPPHVQLLRSRLLYQTYRGDQALLPARFSSSRYLQ